MRSIIVITILSLLIGSNFFIFYHSRTPKTLVCCDEFEYYTIAKNLTEGNGYSLDAQPPFRPTLLREPGYPLLLALLIKMGGGKLIIAQVFNILLAGATALLLFALSKKLLPCRLAGIPSLLFLLSPRVAYYSWTVLSDMLAVFLVTASIVALARALRSRSRWSFLISGLTFGILALTKMAFLLFLPGLIGMAILLKLIGKKIQKNLYRINDLSATPSQIALILFGFILIIAPWLARNAVQFGALTPTVRTGQLISERTRHYEYVTPALKDLSQTPYDILAGWSTFVPKIEPPIISPSGIPYDAASAPGLFFALRTTHSEQEADRIMVRESIRHIQTHPFLYLIQLPFEFLKFNYLEFVPATFTTLYPLSAYLPLIIGILVLSAILLMALMYGLWILIRTHNGFLGLLLCVLVVYANAVHAFLYVTPRYGFTIYPFILLIVTLGIYSFLQKRHIPYASLLRGASGTVLIISAVCNWRFGWLIPAIARVGDWLSSEPTCVFCTYGQFVLLNTGVSVSALLLGLSIVVYVRMRSILTIFVAQHFKKIVLGIFIFLMLLLALNTINRLYGPDELIHVHSVWYLARNFIPYIDFFQQYHATFWYTLLPIFLLFGETITTIVAMRIAMLFVALLICLMTYRIARIIFDRTTALTTLPLLGSFIIFTDRVIDIRPDVLQVLFQLWAIYCLFMAIYTKKWWYIAAGGILTGIAFLFMQKALLFFMLIMAILFFFHRKLRLKKRYTALYIFCGILTVLPYYISLWQHNLLQEYLITNWRVHMIGPYANARDFFLSINLSFIQNPLLWLCIGIGTLYILWHGTLYRRIFILLSYGLLVSVFLYKLPYPHYYLPVAPLLAIVGAYGLLTAARVMKLSENKKLLLLGLVVAVPSLFFLLRGAYPATSPQLDRIRFVLEHTTATDTVYDGRSQFNVFRKDVHFFWYDTQQLRLLYEKFRPHPYNVCDIIREKNPKIISDFWINLKECAAAKKYKTTEYPHVFIRS